MRKRIERWLLFLTVLFLPTQLGKHFWPQLSFVYSLPIDYLSPTIFFWDLLVVGLIMMWVFNKSHINRTALNLLLIFILSQILSLVGGDEIKIGHGLVRLEQYLIAGLFGVYIASAKWKVISTKLFWGLSLAVLGESLFAILQFLKGGTLGFWILGERTFSLSTPAIAKFDFQGIQFLRPYATFPHPNVLAAFMLIVLPLLSFLKPKGGGWLVKVSSIFGGITTILTFSRVALLAGFLEMLVIFKRKVFVWLALVLILLSPFLYIRFSALFNFDNLSLLRREELTSVAWNLFLSHPIFGIGLNNFIPYAADSLLAGPSRFLQPVHNIFLLALSETGILGFLGMLGFIGYPVKKIINYQITVGYCDFSGII